MTKINLDLTDTITKATEAAKVNVEREIRSVADGVVRTLLHNGMYRKEGAVHELIRLKIEEYVLSDKFSQKVDAFIEQSVDPAMEEALMLLMRSKARKVLFQPTSPVESERV